MKKHAYMIIAHNEIDSLVHLLKELDDPRNDIYLHIDKKSQEINTGLVKAAVSKSNLFFVPRLRVYWGTISQVKCELLLIKEALKGQYHYYHLISGVDFPLKSQDYIHGLLENDDKEYLSYHLSGENGDDFLYKLKIYYPLLGIVGKGYFEGNSLKAKIGRKLGIWQRSLDHYQEAHNVDRTRKNKDIVFYKGDQWFSITHDFAEYVLKHKSQILKTYSMTNGPDEIFMATAAMNSSFSHRVVNNSFREIDWERGTPYEFKLSDLEELKSSDKLFARKILYSKEPELVEALSEYIQSGK